MTAGYHKHISPLSRLARISEGLTEQAKAKKNPAPQIWLLGDLTDRAEKELMKQGWQVQTQVQSKLIKQKSGDSK